MRFGFEHDLDSEDGPNEQSTSDDKHTSIPSIAAAFLVVFDVRKGYTITWQESVQNLKLDGVVEFKALPSGLHNVEEDVVYFTYENYVGVSVFIRQDDTAAARNTSMLAVGVLTPLEAGRMAKSWLHVPLLKKLAQQQQEHSTQYDDLEKFWDEHKITADTTHSSDESHALDEGYRKLSIPNLTRLSAGTHILPPHHPALLLTDLFDTFGPLIFPVFRAALLHKRILILGQAPVEITCNYVYNISVLTSLSRSFASFIPIEDATQLRLQPLFNVGVSDIDTLSELKSGWIACTTDDVLCSKPQLFDLLVIMPTSDSSGMQKLGNKRYPKLIVSTPELARAYPKQGLKATQRDAKRYQSLKIGLRPLPDSSQATVHASSAEDEEQDDKQSLKSTVSSIADQFEAVEASGWPLIAYTSLVWWWSSGDSTSGFSAANELEEEQDRTLLQESVHESGSTKETAIVAYFHRMSHMMLIALSQAVRRSTNERYRDEPADSAESDALVDQDVEDEPVDVGEDDIRAMGLDVWNDNDYKFIIEMVKVWWDREATVRGSHIECCGLRIL